MSGEAGIALTLIEHDVYGSLKAALREVGRAKGIWVREEKLEYRYWLRLGPRTFGFGITGNDYRSGIRVVQSPLLYDSAWKCNKRKTIIIEEVVPSSALVQHAYGLILRHFKKSLFISQTPRTQEYLRSLGLKSILIPPAKKKEKGYAKRKGVLYIATAREFKNPFFALELAQKLKGVEFYFVLRWGNLLEEVKAKAPANAQVLGFLKKKELRELYKKSALLILPSLKEPIGYAAVEALSYGCPVLVSTGCGVSDFVPEFTVKGFGVEEWKRRIREVLEKNAQYQKRAMKAFRRNFSFSSTYYKEGKKALEKEIERMINAA